MIMKRLRQFPFDNKVSFSIWAIKIAYRCKIAFFFNYNISSFVFRVRMVFQIAVVHEMKYLCDEWEIFETVVQIPRNEKKDHIVYISE